MRVLDELKRDVFFQFIELVGRAYIHVKHSENVKLGRRGFVGEEFDRGIMLVLNSKMNFTWDEDGIQTTLLFGTAPEKCFIPVEDIIAVYSPELGAQFTVSQDSRALNDGESDREQDDADKVIKVDFSKGKNNL